MRLNPLRINHVDVTSLVGANGISFCLSRVFPGFIDSHIHVGLTGRAKHTLDLKGCSSIEDLKTRLNSFANANPNSLWICGSGWEQDVMGRWAHLLQLRVRCD